jgi:hypothetical protein
MSASAQAQSRGTKRINGITISPAFQDVTLTQEKDAETFKFSVTNNTSEPHEFSLSVVDFGSLDESGGVLFVGETERKLNYHYGLSSWVTLERDRLVVEPKRTETVKVSVINKESLSPGGHYGAVMLSPVSSTERPTKVQINQVLSSLLFVRKQGGEIYNFGLKSYEAEGHIFKIPDEAQFRFQNAGNVHIVPRGTVTVTDPKGRLVKRGIINTGSAIILPESFRQVKDKLESVGVAWLPGTYTMTVAYRIDGQDAAKTLTSSYFYISFWYVIGVVLLFAVAIMMVVSKRFRRFIVHVAYKPVALANRAMRR